ncbi:MAG: hypothetical protein A2017_19070 [Lentisphaerae bacterium GWF2_44_16]|nr:MAG: hypothetical protein A2017_19070 [Lentisphaerae bacterium GWF2_44_16]
MKIIIVGAGELGQYLTSILIHDRHDIIAVDLSDDILDRLKENYDIMTVHGNGCLLSTLRKCGLGDADLLVAVSGDEAANILSCQIASHFGAGNTICKLNSVDFFPEKSGFKPSDLKLKHILVPAAECVDKIVNVLDNKIILDQIAFSNPNALMTLFEIGPSSPLAGLRIKDFPVLDLINSVRFSAIIRDRQHIIPHGDTTIVQGDRIYAAGPRDKVMSMINWVSPDNSSISTVIIAGTTIIARKLASELCGKGYEVRVIEKDRARAEAFLDGFPYNLIMINGGPTEKEVMTEAGINSCDAFVSALNDDEENILSCILAKKMGAKKVITVTNKSEYVDIVPAMDMIDCGFNSSLVAVNSILRIPEIENYFSIDAILHHINAYLYEYKVQAGSPACGRTIDEIKFPKSVVIALVFRRDEVISASGGLRIMADDIVATIATLDMIKTTAPFFSKRGFLSL